MPVQPPTLDLADAREVARRAMVARAASDGGVSMRHFAMQPVIAHTVACMLETPGKTQPALRPAVCKPAGPVLVLDGTNGAANCTHESRTSQRSEREVKSQRCAMAGTAAVGGERGDVRLT